MGHFQKWPKFRIFKKKKKLWHHREKFHELKSFRITFHIYESNFRALSPIITFWLITPFEWLLIILYFSICLHTFHKSLLNFLNPGKCHSLIKGTILLLEKFFFIICPIFMKLFMHEIVYNWILEAFYMRQVFDFRPRIVLNLLEKCRPNAFFQFWR